MLNYRYIAMMDQIAELTRQVHGLPLAEVVAQQLDMKLSMTDVRRTVATISGGPTHSDTTVLSDVANAEPRRADVFVAVSEVTHLFSVRSIATVLYDPGVRSDSAFLSSVLKASSRCDDIVDMMCTKAIRDRNLPAISDLVPVITMLPAASRYVTGLIMMEIDHSDWSADILGACCSHSVAWMVSKGKCPASYAASKGELTITATILKSNLDNNRPSHDAIEKPVFFVSAHKIVDYIDALECNGMSLDVSTTTKEGVPFLRWWVSGHRGLLEQEICRVATGDSLEIAFVEGLKADDDKFVMRWGEIFPQDPADVAIRAIAHGATRVLKGVLTSLETERIQSLLEPALETDNRPITQLVLDACTDLSFDMAKRVVEAGFVSTTLLDQFRTGALSFADESPIHFAARVRNQEFVKAALKIWPGHVHQPGSDDDYPYHIALRNGDFEMAAWFLDQVPQLMTGSKGDTVYHAAAEGGLLTWVRDTRGIIKQFDLLNDNDETVLHMIARSGTVDDARLATSFMVRGDAPNLAGDTPLGLTAQRGDSQLFDVFLAHSVVEDADYLLGCAVLSQNRDFLSHVSTKLEKRASTTSCKVGVSSPMELAATAKWNDGVQLLVERYPDTVTESSLDVIASHTNESTLDLICRSFPNFTTTLIRNAARHGRNWAIDRMGHDAARREACYLGAAEGGHDAIFNQSWDGKVRTLDLLFAAFTGGNPVIIKSLCDVDPISVQEVNTLAILDGLWCLGHVKDCIPVDVDPKALYVQVVQSTAFRSEVGVRTAYRLDSGWCVSQAKTHENYQIISNILGVGIQDPKRNVMVMPITDTPLEQQPASKG